MPANPSSQLWQLRPIKWIFIRQLKCKLPCCDSRFPPPCVTCVCVLSHRSKGYSLLLEVCVTVLDTVSKHQESSLKTFFFISVQGREYIQLSDSTDENKKTEGWHETRPCTDSAVKWSSEERTRSIHLQENRAQKSGVHVQLHFTKFESKHMVKLGINMDKFTGSNPFDQGLFDQLGARLAPTALLVFCLTSYPNSRKEHLLPPPLGMKQQSVFPHNSTFSAMCCLF